MRKRWQVVVIGRGWSYRDVVRSFVTRTGAQRFARDMERLDRQCGIVPLTYSIEKTP